VTLESEALLAAAGRGGDLLRIELAEAAPLGAVARLEARAAGRAMERDAVIVAGFGFRAAATADSLADALARGRGTPTCSPPRPTRPPRPRLSRLRRGWA
jgi:hypothetical protein